MLIFFICPSFIFLRHLLRTSATIHSFFTFVSFSSFPLYLILHHSSFVSRLPGHSFRRVYVYSLPFLVLSIILPLLCMHRTFFTFILPYFLFALVISLRVHYQTSYWWISSHSSTYVPDSARAPRFMPL